MIRYARPADGPALTHLAALTDRPMPEGPFLVGEADGEIVAAMPVAGGDVIGDPFRVTLDVAELLRLRSSQLRAAA